MTEGYHYKLTVDMNKIETAEALELVIDTLAPGAAEPLFFGWRFLMARYTDRDTAYARALDIESLVYCGQIDVEKVTA